MPAAAGDIFDQFPLTVSQICWIVRVLHECDSFRVLQDQKRESYFFMRSAERAVFRLSEHRLVFQTASQELSTTLMAAAGTGPVSVNSVVAVNDGLPEETSVGILRTPVASGLRA